MKKIALFFLCLVEGIIFPSVYAQPTLNRKSVVCLVESDLNDSYDVIITPLKLPQIVNGTPQEVYFIDSELIKKLVSDNCNVCYPVTNLLSRCLNAIAPINLQRGLATAIYPNYLFQNFAGIQCLFAKTVNFVSKEKTEHEGNVFESSYG